MSARIGLVSIAVSLLALGAAQAQTPPSFVPTFIKDGAFKACFDPTFPPMEFKDQPGAARPSGFDVDMVDALGKLWKARPDIVVSEFTGLLPGLEAGRCDIVASGATITEARTQKFDAVPYLATAYVWMTKADAPALKEPADLAGKTVAVQAGTSFVDRVKTLNDELKKAGKPEVALQTYPNGTDVAQQVLLGRAYAAMTLDSEVAWRATVNPGQFKVAYRYPSSDSYGIYLRKNGNDRADLQRSMAELKRNGTLEQIAQHWKIDPAGLSVVKEP
jgi:polar amino acid transport system substrate-binding protein